MFDAFPDSPEAVALCLFAMIVSAHDERGRNDFKDWALDLFAQCLRAANGERCRCAGMSEARH